MHVPNAHHRPKVAAPKHATVPRPYIPHAKHFYDSQEKLAQRSAAGEILGKTQPSRVEQNNVPYTEEGYVPNIQGAEEQWDIPVGPDNPVQPYDEAGVWSVCWDDEAEAVYYYNNENGEATWVPPSA
jgi:hypothetical protein